MLKSSKNFKIQLLNVQLAWKMNELKQNRKSKSFKKKDIKEKNLFTVTNKMMQKLYELDAVFLNPGTIDILGKIILWWGKVVS